ncbi:MAG: ExbD/TolR family protein [Kiritimatiellales bacterium]
MNLYEKIEEVKLEMQIAPLIDVVFLLLIYFMVTAALMKKEGDISFILPANVAQQEMVSVPVEVLIEIGADGTVVLEGMQFPPGDEDLSDLVLQVKGLKQIATSQQSPFFVNLLPHRNALHQRIIDVMDACAAADVQSLTFSRSM